MARPEWLVRPLRLPLDAAAVRPLWYGLRHGVFLESVTADESATASAAASPQEPIPGAPLPCEQDRYSIYALGAEPPECFPSEGSRDPFAWIADELARGRIDTTGAPIPFVGGWIGFLGYECGLFVEPFARRHRGCDDLPMAAWWRCDTVLVRDHAARQWWLAGCDLPGATSRPPIADRLDDLERRLRDAPPVSADSFDSGRRTGIASDPAEPRAPRGAGRDASSLRALGTRADYAAGVRRVLEHIRDGDVYQVNLAQCHSAEVEATPAQLYERLRRSNPARLAAHLAWNVDAAGRPRNAVLSSSPELFLSLRGRRVVTRPIKGTRPRLNDAARDAAARRDLESSAKDRAELIMIVDLLRNDLGRVCEPGTVRVTSLGETEAHPTVLHRVATIEGTLSDGCGAADLLRAAFPCGSITGAPKVRAMQIIDALEPEPRGPYCGAIGCIGAQGDLTLNVAIRTMAYAGGRVRVWGGAGIVADSDPEVEYDETLAKIEGLRRAIDQTDAPVNARTSTKTAPAATATASNPPSSSAATRRGPL